MSLLDRGHETVIIDHAVKWTDDDGNIMWRPDGTDVETVTNVVIQVEAQSGTSARRTEQDEEGYDTERIYRMRLPRSYTRTINFASQVEWNGLRWAVNGWPKLYRASYRTGHADYSLRRV